VLVIALIALIVLGPSRLPNAARQAGKVMGDLRRISAGFQNEVRTAFDDADRKGAQEIVPPTLSPSNPALTPGTADITDTLAAVSAQAAPPPKGRTAAKTTAADKAPAKRSAAKKAPAKKVPAKATAAKKAPTKKTAAKKAPTKKAAAKKAPAKRRSA
jgi:Sec-independent protein translocase protein TatA